MDTIGPFPNTSSRNNYIVVAIEYYSKCCEAKRVLDHIGVIVTYEISNRWNHLPLWCSNCVLIDNGGEWVVEFDNVCKVCDIFHQ